jgi:hypothetical protein
MKIRYNQQSSNNDEDSESIEKNNTCPRLNNFTPNKKKNYKYPNEYYYNILSNDFNDNNNIINNYNNKTNPKSTHSKQKMCKNNSDYDGDNNIFTRIVPNFEDDKKNNSSIPCENYILYNNKTYDVHKKKLPKNSSFIYCKSKTPTKKCIYHRKKRKNNLYENENISINSEADSNLYNNNGSASNDYDDFSIDSKKLQLILNSGVHFDIKDKNNDYIDLNKDNNKNIIKDEINLNLDENNYFANQIKNEIKNDFNKLPQNMPENNKFIQNNINDKNKIENNDNININNNDQEFRIINNQNRIFDIKNSLNDSKKYFESMMPKSITNSINEIVEAENKKEEEEKVEEINEEINNFINELKL